MATSVASAEKLTHAQCSLIQGYGEVSKDTFSEHFTKMVHQREYCRSTGENCEIPLQKRMKDFYVLFDGGKTIESKVVKKALISELSMLFHILPDFFNLTLIFEKPTEADQFPLINIIAVNFINIQNINANFEEYFNEKIDAESHPEYNFVKKTFKNFMKGSDVCRVNLSDPDDSGIKSVHIWVRTDISKIQMQQCISESFYTSLGLGSSAEVESIFDYKYARTEGDYSLFRI